jgi:hypothetical protein
MGYTTSFTGFATIEPELNLAEYLFLVDFAKERHEVGSGAPSYYCQWVPGEDGDTLGWDQGEKFDESVAWMQYLIDNFLKPGAVASTSRDPRFVKFQFNHMVNGAIEAYGEEPGDVWQLVIKDNKVKRVDAVVTFPEDDGEPADPDA